MQSQGFVEWVIQWEASSGPPTLQAARDNGSGYHFIRSVAPMEAHTAAAKRSRRRGQMRIPQGQQDWGWLENIRRKKQVKQGKELQELSKYQHRNRIN